MVQLSDDLAKFVKIVPSGKRLIGLPLNVEYRALAADGGTAQGLSPRLAIIDEAGQVRGPSSDFVEAILTAQGAYDDALVITISTQAPHDVDMLSQWIDDAKNSGDPSIVCHVYEAPKDCELNDRRAWKASNPALGKFRSEADLENLATVAARMPSAEASFRNLNLNQRVEAHAPFVTRSVWESNGAEVDPAVFRDNPVYVGIDLSARTDLTAIVLVAQDPTTLHWHVQTHCFTPEDGLAERSKRDRTPYDVWVKQGFLHTTPGSTVDYDYVAEWLLENCSEMDLQTLAYDRWRIDVFTKALGGADAPHGLVEKLTPFGQGTKDMSPAIDTLEAELVNGRVHHGAHPVLTACAANARVWKDSSGNRKFEKQKSTGRIDAMVALAMAIGVSSAAVEDEEPFVVAL
jgi:phage terminase large subunit-like protein